MCRELLGDDLVFMNLSMGKEDKMKRLLARHGGDEQTASMFDVSFSFIFVLPNDLIYSILIQIMLLKTS